MSEDDTAQPASQTASTVERAADVLVLFAESARPTLGVTEIADKLSLSKAAVHRILASLRSRGLVELDEETRRYALGLMSMRLGLAYLDRIDLRGIAAPELAALSAETGETATLSVRSGDSRIYLEQVTPAREVRMSVTLGVPYPLHVGASSKAFLAFLPEAERDAYLTRHAPGERGTLNEQAEHVRQVGYAVSYGERQPGAGSVAAPVFDHTGRPAAAVSVCGPLERFRNEADSCAKALLQATTRISSRLGHTT
ncbi:IclR family transcriptional regulator [Sinosporangium siamense]|uniref:Glycerol operon regulatory protein n=1 Tax=Sinosporangium siamense TaxID=1367973 RepID=A0A919RSK3_9ACTN|nr:IclR family transcriptional regulator [Sinosporangium siamense]GII97509.1 IclR family transcriptional regulator [Sinosporangium siamense]